MRSLSILSVIGSGAMFSEGPWSDGDELEPEPYEPIEPNPIRRRIIVSVAVVTAIALAALPVYNLINARERPVADNGLEICGFDYCLVQEAVIAAGLNETMSRLANIYLGDAEAIAFFSDVLAMTGETGVDLVLVDRLDGKISGDYSPDTRTIRVERPARAWIILHEVAHVGEAGHGADFQEALIDLTRRFQRPTT